MVLVIKYQKFKKVQLSNNAQVKVSVDEVTLMGQIGDETIDCDKKAGVCVWSFQKSFL